jgi:signal transduction histidine kinase
VDRPGHVGVAMPLRQLTQVTLLVRLCGLAAGLLALSGTPLSLATTVGFLVVGLTSFFGLMNTSVLDLARRHPLIAMADAVLLAAIVAINGIDSPLLLAALTTALLLGLWLEPVSGALVMVCLVSLYVGAALLGADGTAPVFTAWVTIPFVYVTLWLLGLTMRRSVESESRAQMSLRDAVTTAAATEERTKVARELHDNLAKSLQGIAMIATALPLQLERHPERAAESAISIREMAAAAVHQVRGVMVDLRAKTSHGTLSEAATQVALGWAARSGRSPHLVIDDVDAGEEAMRYELLSVLGESLDNVHRHAGPCDVTVELHEDHGVLALTVRDTGTGFDADTLGAAQAAGHHGVDGMQERMARVGGWCSVTGDPGRGTLVECRVPVLHRVER